MGYPIADNARFRASIENNEINSLVLTAFYRFAVFRDAEAERCHAFRIRNAARTRSGLFFSGEVNSKSFD